MPTPQGSTPLSALSSSHDLPTIGSSQHTRGSQPPSPRPTHPTPPLLHFTCKFSTLPSAAPALPSLVNVSPITVSCPIAARAFMVCSLNNPAPSTGLGTWFLLNTHLWIAPGNPKRPQMGREPRVGSGSVGPGLEFLLSLSSGLWASLNLSFFIW